MVKKKKSSILKKVIFIVFSIVLVFILIASGIFLFQKNKEVKFQSSLSSFYASENVDDKELGEVLRISSMNSALTNGKAYRFVYVSEAPKNKKVPVSGMIFVPNMEAKGKRNIVAWAHGTVGLGENCAPSRSEDPASNLNIWLNKMMDKNWIVVATDYYGLGMKGEPQYLIGESEAKDVLNSLRAAKSLEKFNPGDNTAIFGHSQGGHSAIFATNFSVDYAPELNIKGVVAAAPAVEMTQLMTNMYNKLASWIIGPYITASWKNHYDLPLKGILTEDGINEYEDRSEKCVIDSWISAKLKTTLNQRFFNTDPNSDTKWLKALKNETPAPVLSVPILLLQGSADDIVAPDSTLEYAKKSCNTGSKMKFSWLNGVGHSNLPSAASEQIVSWINNRFNNVQEDFTCQEDILRLN